ncbi:MAG TPA: hypothetical protein P5531_10640 [Bacteroidales bacterium]|nr:hypothetical protein [Bacteroidales bacterium]HSA43581.1 hypothetical protein [Bacteroidales bacterium]
MNADQDWVAAYIEIAGLIIENIPEIKFVDLWAQQVDSPENEYPFPVPAAFIEVNSDKIDDLAVNAQAMNMEIRIYLLFIPSEASHEGATGHVDISKFGEILRKIYRLLQGKAGDNFGQCTRIALTREQAPPYEWLYSQTFTTMILDYSAQKAYEEGELEEVQPEEGGIPEYSQDNFYRP